LAKAILRSERIIPLPFLCDSIAYVLKSERTNETALPRAEAIRILAKAAASLPCNLIRFPVERVSPELKTPWFRGRLIPFPSATLTV
jgi:hypothetical protein